MVGDHQGRGWGKDAMAHKAEKALNMMMSDLIDKVIDGGETMLGGHSNGDNKLAAFIDEQAPPP